MKENERALKKKNVSKTENGFFSQSVFYPIKYKSYHLSHITLPSASAFILDKSDILLSSKLFKENLCKNVRCPVMKNCCQLGLCLSSAPSPNTVQN